LAWRLRYHVPLIGYIYIIPYIGNFDKGV